MEASQRTGGTDGGQKTWLLGFQWSYEGMTLDEAREKAEQIADYAEGIGVNRVAGSVANARERDAIESFEFGSQEPFRNQHAITGHSSVAGAIASGSGARQPA
ncbi:MAG: hypothetical protein QOF36_2579 [Microbacteriaceae bacterium]|jgi:hypothetical protein|nr:hypothetical protein [Microbacteriaceae bacterium]